MADLPETAEWVEGIYQLEKSDPVSGGAEINPVTKQGISNLPLLQLAKRTAWLRKTMDDQYRADTFEVTVGSGGDFPTLNVMFGDLSRMGVSPNASAPSATIRILSGYVQEEQIFLRSPNMGWSRIIADDPVVPIVRENVTASLQGFSSLPFAFTVLAGAVFPVVDCKFEMDNSGVADGQSGFGFNYSQGEFLPGAGLINAHGQALRTSGGGSGIRGPSSVFHSKQREAVAILEGASNLASADLSSDNGSIVLDIDLGGYVHGNELELSGGATRGVRSQRGSFINLLNADCRLGGSDDPNDITVANGGFIAAHGATGGMNVAANTLTSSGIIFK